MTAENPASGDEYQLCDVECIGPGRCDGQLDVSDVQNYGQEDEGQQSEQ